MSNEVIAPYKPLPWQIKPFYDTSSVLLLSGSAGGGKSRLAAEKVHAFMMRYEGATGLVLRKAREFVTKSAVALLATRVIGNDSRVRMYESKGYFQYWNGSRLYWGGMRDEQQQEALKSMGQDGAFDIIWPEEANALIEKDWNQLLSRLRGTAAPWRQIIPTTNPDAPTHWIKRRLIDGKEASVYYSSAKDNPYLPDDYYKNLEMLTGVQYQRLVLGKWVQSEGAIYDTFDSEYNVTFDAEYTPDRGYVYWGVDDGYAEGNGVGSPGHHPRVILLAQVGSDGTIYVFDEYYKTLELPEATVRDVLERPYPPPRFALVDSSATILRRIISDAGIMNAGATHRVEEGIKIVRSKILDGNGMRLLKIHPRCTNTIREMQTYERDNSIASYAGEQKPKKMNDHTCDALRYLCYGLNDIR